MEQPQQRRVVLIFTDYECAPYEDRMSDDDRCLHASDDRWVTAEEMDLDYLVPAFRRIWDLMQKGDTLRITLEVKTPRTRKKR